MGFGCRCGDWVLKVVLLLQPKEIYVLCENFMYTGLPPISSCPCSCPCGWPPAAVALAVALAVAAVVAFAVATAVAPCRCSWFLLALWWFSLGCLGCHS